MYVIVWEFKVPESRQREFEHAYGSSGLWAGLFGKAEGFVGVELLCSGEEQGLYLTLDRWESETAFDKFIREFAADYAALDGRLEGLAEAETRIGAFRTDG